MEKRAMAVREEQWLQTIAAAKQSGQPICKNRHPSPICTRFEHHLAGGLAPLSRTEAPLALSHFWASLPVRCRNRTLSDMCTEF